MRSVVISECDVFKKSNVVQNKLHNFVIKKVHLKILPKNAQLQKFKNAKICIFDL